MLASIGTIGEITGLVGSVTILLGVILKQTSKVKQGIEFQLDRITQLEKITKEAREASEKTSKPIQDVKAKVESIKSNG